MKTAISLPDRLFALADKSARSLGISRSELYRRALEEFLARHKTSEITEALNRVYATEDSSLDPGLAALQSRSVREEW